MDQAIEHEVELGASPSEVYKALADGAAHSDFTGAPAEISTEAGGEFSCFGGAIVGRNVELVPDARIVQAWRPADWPEGVYSMVSYELEGAGDGTKLRLTHSSIPDGMRDQLEQGWNQRYWEPLRERMPAG